MNIKLILPYVPTWNATAIVYMTVLILFETIWKM